MHDKCLVTIERHYICMIRYFGTESLCYTAEINITNQQCCAVLSLVAQLCPTLCDPMDWSPPGSSVNGDSPGKNTGVGCHVCDIMRHGFNPWVGKIPWRRERLRGSWGRAGGLKLQEHLGKGCGYSWISTDSRNCSILTTGITIPGLILDQHQFCD